MSSGRSLAGTLHKMLQDSDLPFRDFVEVALYYPELGYYAKSASPVGRQGDFVTSPQISPVFSFVLSLLVSEFVRFHGAGLCTIVDIGCGDGSLIHSLYEALGVESAKARFWGVDRSLDRVQPRDGVEFTTNLADVPRGGAQLVISNELFDALPFARL